MRRIIETTLPDLQIGETIHTMGSEMGTEATGTMLVLSGWLTRGRGWSRPMREDKYYDLGGALAARSLLYSSEYIIDQCNYSAQRLQLPCCCNHTVIDHHCLFFCC